MEPNTVCPICRLPSLETQADIACRSLVTDTNVETAPVVTSCARCYAVAVNEYVTEVAQQPSGLMGKTRLAAVRVYLNGVGLLHH